MNILLIDDKKSPAAALHFYNGKYNIPFGKDHLFHIARTYASAIQQLSSINWDVVLLDYDLGLENGDTGDLRTGDDVLDWLEAHPTHIPLYVFPVSMNAVGRKRMVDRLSQWKQKGWIKDYE